MREIYGEGDYRYELAENWGEIPPEWGVTTVPGICIDERERIYALSRNNPPVFVMNTEGKLLEHWGDGTYARPHGIYLNEKGMVFSADDEGHTVYKFDEERKLLLTLGTKGVPSDTGCIGKQWKTIRQASGPFNYPTNAVEAPNGDIYVSDGYGNARVHVFDPEGRLKFSFGAPGTAPGQFNLPHSLRFDKNALLYVCDRGNNRIQIFDLDGSYVTEWTGFERPADLFFGEDGIVYVAECKRCSVFDGSPSRVTLLNSQGVILARVGGDKPYSEGSHHTAHGIAVDRSGALYVAEVGKNYPTGYVGLKKYRRV